MRGSAKAPNGADDRFAWSRDGAALFGLLVLSAWFVAVSWRKWPDTLIDFGRELYTPWRMSEGAVLYRDVDCYYGPLSQHLNALLFWLFGPSLMVLVAANLVIFAGIVGLLYFLCRRAWGRIPAFVASGLFVAVFGFSQLVWTGNFNFATPYAHETTHGFLICLALVALLERWMRAPGTTLSLFAGGFWGLTAVLKPEFMLAGGLVTAVAAAWRWRHHELPGIRLGFAWSTGAILPSALFCVYFTRDVSWSEAADYCGRAWLNVVGPNADAFTNDFIQAGMLGTDFPVRNFLRQLSATAIALGVLAGVVGIAWLGGRVRHVAVRFGVWGIGAAAIVGVGATSIEWNESGSALPGLITIAVAYAGISAWRRSGGASAESAGREALAFLLVVLAGALLTRMALNARIFYYGYFQAALSAVVVSSMVLSELARRLSSRPSTSWAAVAGVGLLLATGAVAIAANSARYLSAKSMPIGEGPDRFLAFPPEYRPIDSLVRTVVEGFANQPEGGTLVVLPEGEMLNYLARKRSTVAPFTFFGSSTAGGREADVVRNLAARPPDWIAIVSRGLREYGIERYGEEEGSGKLILEWVGANYVLAGRAGGDPLDPDDLGAVILRRKP